MNKAISISLIIILSFLCCGYSQITYLDSANHNNSDNIDKKIEKIEEKSNENAEDYFYYLALSGYHISNTLDYKAALVAANKALLLVDEDCDEIADLYRMLGLSCILVGDYKEGKEWFKKIKDYNSQDNACIEEVLFFCVDKRDYITAVKILNEIEYNNPESDFYHDIIHYYVEICIKEKNENVGEVFEWLLKLFKAAIELQPDNYKAQRAYGISLRDSAFYSESKDYRKEFPTIMDCFQKALDLNDQYVPTYICIANAYDYLAEVTSDNNYRYIAMDWLYMADEIEPGNVRLPSVMGYVAYKMKDYDLAIEKLELACENYLTSQAKEDLAYAYNSKAYNLYVQNQNLDYGLELIDKAIELFPDDGIIIGTKAELLYKKGEYKEAYKYITKALELEPDHEEMQQDLINIKAALNNKINIE